MEVITTDDPQLEGIRSPAEETEVEEGSKEEEGIDMEQIKRIKTVGADDVLEEAWKVFELAGTKWLTYPL